jgi:energy-coupling factor transport system permease protein
MSVLAVTAPAGRLARRNPVAKLAVTVAPTLVLVASLDLVTPAVVVASTVALLPLAQVGWRRLASSCRVLAFGVVMVAVVNAVFAARHSGGHLVDLGPVHVSTGSAEAGLGIGLRALGIGLPGIVVLAATDPVDLADSLVQQLRVPAKFAYGTLAALRLLPLLAEEWVVIAMARRARGLDSGRSPVRVLRLFASQAFALLVVAIRRGTRLALAMDARGFDSGLPRSVARRQVVTAADWWMVALSVLAAAAALAVSITTGAWQASL